jgi:hypothetical protein
VRVLFVYTDAAAAQSSDIKQEIKLAVSLANQAYKNGKIKIVLELAGMMKVKNYNEGNDFSQNLTDLTSGSAFNPVRKKRGKVDADLVQLFRTSGNACGIADAYTQRRLGEHWLLRHGPGLREQSQLAPRARPQHGPAPRSLRQSAQGLGRL